MPRPFIFVLLLTVAVVVPAQARHTARKAAGTTVAPEVKSAVLTPRLVQASTKGSRLVAVVPLPVSHRPVAKVAVAKSDSVVKTAPTLATVPPVPLLQNNSPLKLGTIPLQGCLARITAYWTQEDPCTARHESSTGVTLHEGVCAVDPKMIPYGSMLQIPGMGNFVAVDTGSAVISRQAALGSGHTTAERNALVIDLFFEHRREAEDFAAHGPAFATVSWSKPVAATDSPLNPRALPAVPTLPAGAVYVLAEAPSLADCRLPLAFRTPQL